MVVKEVGKRDISFSIKSVSALVSFKIERKSRMFRKKKTTLPLPYDPTTRRPVLRCSICTGEQVAGFRDIRTGKFEEVMLIRDEKDLKAFMEMYGLDSVPKEY